MKCRLIFGVRGAEVRDRVPQRYLAYLAKYELNEEQIYCVLMFPEEVVLSRSARKALRMLPDGERPIALARDFTLEADIALRERGIDVPLAEFGWTDESYIRIRQRI
jgi:hypothetical protein